MKSPIFRFAALVLATPAFFACLAEDLVVCGIPTTTLTHDGGNFTESEFRSVTFTLKADRQANIFFTLDGTPPKAETANCKNGPTFCGESPISNIPFVYDGMTLQYFAIDTCGNQERVKTDILRIDRAPTTVADPPPGLYNKPITVALTASDESAEVSAPTIYWTTDGSSPDPANPNVGKSVGAAQIPLQNSVTLKWFAIDNNNNQETEKTGQYTIDALPPLSEASPKSGFFDGAIDVVVKIVNDTGTLYLTTTGGIPLQNDPNGHTQTAALQTTLTLAESTILRFTSVDKAGNVEHAAGAYNQEIYVIDGLPAVIATPPGGTYSESELTITVTGAPASDTNLFFSIAGGAEAPYMGPFTIQGSEGADVVVTLRAQRTGQVQSVTKTETYTLGIAGSSQNFVESFANTTFIDTDETTAQIDTTAQKAVIPNFTFSQVQQKTNTFVGNVQMGDQFGWAKSTLYNAAVRARTVTVVDGLYFGVDPSGEAGVGIKFYTWPNNAGSDLSPELTFSGQWFIPAPTPPDLILAADLFLAGLTVPAAAIATLSGTLAFLNIADTANPTTIAVIDDFEFSRGGQAALLAQYNDLTENYVFATRHTGAAGGDNHVVAITVDVSTQTATIAGAVTLTATSQAVNRDIIALAFDPAALTNGRILALTLDCQLWRIDFTAVANPVTSLVSSTICPSGAQARALLAVDVDAIGNAAFVAYTTSSGNNVASVDLGIDGISLIGTIRRGILGSNAPADDIWKLHMLFNSPFSSERTLAVAAGSEGFALYDAANLSATLFPLVEKRAIAGFEVDGLARYRNPAGDEIVFGNLRDAVFPDFRGGIATWKAAGAPLSAVVQSKNFNGSGKNIKSLKLENVTPDDAVLYFSTNGTLFNIGPVTAGQVAPLSPAASSVYWRSTLEVTGVSELENVNIRMSLE